ncbi:hypothetical protein OIO90_002640 [Microbotryomycetes sp. JL221]|nr:hypothetical protein OIO90_002640 [Microbotryomycetes sp. JL221]
MADQDSNTGALAFQDEFTQSYGGNCYFVSVEPVFFEQVSEAASLISRSQPDSQRADFVDKLTQEAKQAQPPQQATTNDEDDDDEQQHPSSQAAPTSPQTDAAKRAVVKQLVQACKGVRLEALDKELEGFVNLVLSLILTLVPATDAEFQPLVFGLAEAVSFSADRSANPSISARYSCLTTIFNSLPSTTPAARLQILQRIIAYAAANDDFAVVQPALVRFEAYLTDFGFGPNSDNAEQGHKAVAHVIDILVSKGRTTEAHKLLLSHLATASSGEVQSDSLAKLASTLIAVSLSLPNVYDFATLTAVPAVAKPSSAPLATLLDIFRSGDVGSFEKFKQDNAQVLTDYKLDATSLATKLKLVALAELCSARVGESVSYKEIASTLQLANDNNDDGEEVETWVIDAIRAGLVSGRLSQSLMTLHVTRATPRSFTNDNWRQLETRLQGWRTSLSSILDSVKKGLNVDSGRGAGAIDVAQTTGIPETSGATTGRNEVTVA